MPKDFSWREIALLCLPFFVIAFGARWAQQRPHQTGSTPKPPQPYHLRVVEFTKLPVTAYDVSRGADTKVRIKIETAGTPPKINFGNWDWSDDFSLVAIKDGRERLFYNDHETAPA